MVLSFAGLGKGPRGCGGFVLVELYCPNPGITVQLDSNPFKVWIELDLVELGSGYTRFDKQLEIGMLVPGVPVV